MNILHTRKPTIELENYPAVYDYYRQYQPNRVLARIGHMVFGALYRAEVSFAEGAEQQTAELLAKGTRLIVAANHITDRDQYLFAAMTQRAEVLHPLRGHTSIASKESVFRKNTIRRHAVDIMGAKPAFRTKDVFAGAEKSDRDADLVCLQRAGSMALRELFVERVTAGEHVVTFAEGERNTGNSRVVQPLKLGVGDIYCGVEPVAPVALLPAGFYYPQRNNEWEYAHPAIHVGVPVTGAFDGPEAVISVLHPAMQESLDQAVAMTFA
jgi:1-acyl-sn-glycerol-3-phosphate acyltransferase